MSIEYNLLRVTVNLDHIRSNYRLLAAAGGNVFCVVKADAYGHGLAPVCRALLKEGATVFCAGTVAEAARLREALAGGDSGCVRVIALLGPLDEADYDLLASHRILPFLSNLDQIRRVSEVATRVGHPLKVALKFDTGMARLGFAEKDVPALLRVLECTDGVAPVMASSHLATADEPQQWGFADAQSAGFQRILEELHKAGLELEANLANSAAILSRPDLRNDAQRAGISLYGSNPFRGTDHEDLGAGLQQAMSVETRLVSVHDLPQGRSISYGRTFTAPRDMRVAIAAAGYADGYSRGLSGKGWMNLRGVRVPIVGRVCMQLTAVDVSEVEDVRVGERIHLLGGEGPGFIHADDLASWWGTISYEVFCILGLNSRTHIS